MTTDTQIRANRQALLGGATPFASDLHPLLPEPVREASDAFAAALARKAEAEKTSMSAAAALKAARREDERGAAAAELEGSAIPKPTAPAAETQAAAAKRAVEAARAAAQTRQHEYLVATLAGRDEILDAAERELGAVAAEFSTALDGAEEALVRIAAMRRLQDALGDDGAALHGRTVVFNPSRQGKQQHRDPLSRDDRALLDGLRAALGTEQP